MKRILLLLLALSASSSAQVVKSLNAANQCANIGALGKATVGIYVTGTFSATLQPEGSIQGQAAFSTQVAPSTSTTLQSTITTGGGYVMAVAGYSTALLCVSAYTSGTAVVYLNASENQLGSTTGGGGAAVTFANLPGGTNTSSAFILGSGSSLSASAAGTGTISLANGSLAAPSLFFTADTGLGFFRLGGTNDVIEWGDNQNDQGAIWGWTGTHSSDGGLFVAPTVYLGFGNAATGVCNACFSQNGNGISVVATVSHTAATLTDSGTISNGTTFTTNNGCTDSAKAGGATAGKFSNGATATCTDIITMGSSATAPTGWACSVTDLTTAAAVWRQTSSTTTTATIQATAGAVAADVISFFCMGY